MIGAGQASGAVFQALRYLGKDGVDDDAITQIARALNAGDKARVHRDSKGAPAWMRPIADQIAAA